MAKTIRGKQEGSLYRLNNGKWRAITPPLNDGKRKTHVGQTKAECQAWLHGAIKEAAQEKHAQANHSLGDEVSVREYLREWVTISQRSLRPKTIHQYERVINGHILPFIGGLKLRQLNLLLIERFYEDLGNAGRGVRTIRISHSVLHRALERAVRYDLILRNPAHGATLPRKIQSEMLVLDANQVSQFLVAAFGTRNEALYHLAIVTGMRQGELFGLKWADLQWQSGALHVHRQAQWVPGDSWSFSEPKTRNGRRTIRLGENTLQVLRQHKERLDQEISIAGDFWHPLDLIFPSKVGTPMNPSNLRLDFNRLLVQAGLPKVRFHDLRHTAASLMLNNGVPVLVASRILGHSKPSVTLDIYGHLYHEMQGEAAKIMDRLVAPVPVAMPVGMPVRSESNGMLKANYTQLHTNQ